MHIGLDRPSAPPVMNAPAPSAPPSPTPQEVGQAQASLRALLPPDAAALDRERSEAALREAIRILLAEQALEREAERRAQEEALRRAAILLQAQADAQRNEQAAQARVAPLRQAASEVGMALAGDARFSKPALDASVAALRRPDASPPREEQSAPASFEWSGGAETAGALLDSRAWHTMGGPHGPIAPAPEQAGLTLLHAHEALDEEWRIWPAQALLQIDRRWEAQQRALQRGDKGAARLTRDDASAAARAELAIEEGLNSSALNANTLRAAFRRAQKQNPTLRPESLVEGAEAALLSSGATTSVAQGARLLASAQVADDATVKRATDCLHEGRLASSANGQIPGDTPALQTQQSGAAMSPLDYLRALLNHGVNAHEAVAATRVWLGGDARRTPELMQAALQALGERLAARPHRGDPAKLALAQVQHDFAPAEQRALTRLADRMAQDASPDTRTLARAAVASLTAHERWRRDGRRHARASRLQHDRQAYQDAVDSGLNAAAGRRGTRWQADALNWERMGKAQQAFAQAYLQADIRQTGSTAGAQQDVTDVQGALEVSAASAQMESAKTQGGAAAAARALTDVLRGAAPADALYRDLLGDGTAAHSGSRAVAALRQEIVRTIQAPLATARMTCTPGGEQAALREAGRQLDRYRGTVLYTSLVDDVLDAGDTRRAFRQIGEQVRAQPDAAGRQHALVQATSGLNRELAQALYHRTFADRQAESEWATSGSAAELSLLYDRLGPNDPDMAALLHTLKRAGETGRWGALERIGAPSRASNELGQRTTAIAFGFDHLPQGMPMQLAHDLAALGGKVGQEVSRETGIKAVGRLARPAKPDEHGNLVDTPDAHTQISVDTQAGLLNALGQAEHLRPARVATSLAQEQQIRNGALALYSGEQVVYAHGGRRTTLGRLAHELMRAEGVKQVSAATPVSFAEQQMSWWSESAASRAGAAPDWIGALLAGTDAEGSTFEIGPADPTARANYAQWQHHSGLVRGLLIASPFAVLDAKGRPLSGAPYLVQHQTGANPWYSRRNLEADAEVAMTVGAVVFSVLAAPEAAPLWAEFGAMALDAAFAVTSVPRGLRDLSQRGPGDLEGWAELTGGLSGGTLAWLNSVRIAARLASSSDRFATQIAELAQLPGATAARAIPPYARTARLGRWLDGDAMVAERTRAAVVRLERGAQRVSGPVFADARGATRVNRLALAHRVTGLAAAALNTTTLGEQAVRMVRMGDEGVRDWVQLLSSVAGLGLGAISARRRDRGDSTDDREAALAAKWRQTLQEHGSAQVERDLLAALTDEVPRMSPPDRGAFCRAVLGASKALPAALQDTLVSMVLYRLSLVPESDRYAFFKDALHTVGRRDANQDDSLWALVLSIGHLCEHERLAAYRRAVTAIDKRSASRQAHLLSALPSAIASIPEAQRSKAFTRSFKQVARLPQDQQTRPLAAHADQVRFLPAPWAPFSIALKAITALPAHEQDAPLWELMALTSRVPRRRQAVTFDGALDAVMTQLPPHRQAKPLAMLASWSTCLPEPQRYAAFANVAEASERLPAPSQAQVAWELARSAAYAAPQDRLAAFTRLLDSFLRLPPTERKGALKALAYRSAAVPEGVWSNRIVDRVVALSPDERASLLATLPGHFDAAQVSGVTVHADRKSVTLVVGDEARAVTAMVLGNPGRIPANVNEFKRLFEVYLTGGPQGQPVVIARIKGAAADRDAGRHAEDDSNEELPTELAAYSTASVSGGAYEVDFDTPAPIREFLAAALSNNAYDSEAHLQERATNYLRHIDSEVALLRSAMARIEQPESPLVAQSSWMVHLERGSWLSDEMFGSLDRNQLADEAAGLIAPAEGSPFFGSTSRKTPLVKRRVQIPAQVRGLLAMMLRGEQGPLTRHDAQLGVPLNNVAKLLAVKLESQAARERVDYWRASRIKANRSNTAIANTALGVDLSRDVCSQVLDGLGLPVATGVSSTLADTVLLAQFVAEKYGQPWIAPGLSEAEAAHAMIDLGLIEIRQGPVPSAVAKGINELRRELGLPPKIVEPEKVFTHSYGEIHVGVHLAINGAAANDAEVITNAAREAALRLRYAGRVDAPMRSDCR